MKHVFIINPTSGKGKHEKLIYDIQEVFKKEDFEIIFTEYKGHAKEIANIYASKYQKINIYACGGDGTLNEVVNGIYEYKHVKLGVLPIGTGNDFVRSLDGYKIEDMLNVKGYLSATERKCDVLKIDDRVAINAVNFGFDVEVARNANKFKALPFMNGVLPYVFSVFYCFFSSLTHYFEIWIDDKKIEKDGYIFVVGANGRYYGGGFQPTPDAKFDDGYIDVCLIKTVSRLKILRFAGKYRKGTHVTHKECVSMYRCKKMQVKKEGKILVSFDGEMVKKENPVVEILEKKVNLLLPNLDKE